MTSRERKNSMSTPAPSGVNESNISGSPSASSRSDKRRARKSRDMRRRQLFETLEQRQLLAGPQLIGIQPNEGELIVDGSVRDTAPRSLTFRFDETQQIDPNTLGAIQIHRAGPDDQFGTADDVQINPGSVALGALRDNEVVVRFADSLPDDQYRIDVFGFDAPARGIVGLRNVQGELLMPRDGVSDTEQVYFELQLGARVEAVVPQPVVRLNDRTLEQRRNEILVYFNDDELFVENDPATGQPTDRSAENPRFYQLLLTQETVRTTDDTLYSPDRVIYDPATNTARLIFAEDINQLPGVPLGGGTFRLRIGTAVDQASDLIIQPTELEVVPKVSSNLGAAAELQVEFVSKVFGESIGSREIQFTDSGSGGLSVALDASSNAIVYDFGGATVTVSQLADVTRNTPAVDALVSIAYSNDGVAGAGGGLAVPDSFIGTSLRMVAAGDTLTTAADIGVFGQDGNQLLSSIVISESIDPQTYNVQLPGALTDPGRNDSDSAIARAINDKFGPDVTDGITEIEYNFKGIFAGGVGSGLPAQLNNITATQKRRIREAVGLWSNYLGVQFRETADSGITFAVGTPDELGAVGGTEIRHYDVLNARLRIDPSFDDPAIVFSNQVNFRTNYGEDFFRKAMAGIGILLGLEQNDDVTAQTLLALDPVFLNATINPNGYVSPVDPFTPSQTRVQQKINPAIDSQTIGQPVPNALEGQEPAFPGRQDILHGQLLHRPDSIDVDLYRFEVALDAGREFGTLTVESFAERLADSSLLDTTLTLFQDVSASTSTNFGLGTEVTVQIDSQLPGNLGNRSRIEFIQTDRVVGDTDIRVSRITADNGELLTNAVRVDLPRRGASIGVLSVGQVIDAINNDPFASSLFDVSLVEGSRGANMIDVALSDFSPIRLSGGGTVPLTRNDDYFSNDSLLTAQVGNGVYYIGVSASGNDQYDPSIPESGFGGRTQGEYELLVKFEPQVSQTDVIRDRDSDRVGVPGTAIDGDLDGKPSGVNNFWFQTRPLERILEIDSDGTGVVDGQTMTITGANGTQRRFEFVSVGRNPAPGNVPITFSVRSNTADLADSMARSINANSGVLGVTATIQTDTSDPSAPAYVIMEGERSVALGTNFQGVQTLGRNLFVDKVASVVADGSLDQPFNNIDGSFGAGAFAVAQPGDIVRVVGNGGQDNNTATATDNFAYQIGISEVGGNVLADGRHMNVPKGVTTIIDAGAAFKMRSSSIGVGSNNLLSDRSGGALQVLGTPRLLQISDPTFVGSTVTDTGLADLGADGKVVFTSTRDRAVDSAASGNSPAPSDGNWGGIIFRSDFDRREGRANLEDQGIFLQVVNHADVRYGGGSNILINSVQQTVNPIQIVDLRPTITFNRITNNASAAMSASPDAFLETRFQAPRFQAAGKFTADYSRVGPDIRQNLIVDNSINGLFIRTVTDSGQPARSLTVAARIDDVDIVHFIAENIIIAGRPGGPIQDGFQPDSSAVSLQTSGGGSLAVGDYRYRVTFVDASGFESLSSDPTPTVSTTAAARRVQLLNLPLISDGADYLTRRLYRQDPATGDYQLIADLNRSQANFVDDGSVTGGAVLDLNREGIRGRLDGSLVIDPNSVVKFRGARIELDHSTQLLAEGLRGQNVVFTSVLDDRFGAGGSFDTNEDAGTPGGGTQPERGDWAGIYAGPTANVSLDNAIVAYGGGVSLIEGGQSKGFAALELQQASARVTNSRFEYNDHAQDGSGPVGRNGRLAITPATIFARYTQPVLVGNQFVDNYGSIIDVDLASMTDELITDAGRQTGAIDLMTGLEDNHGPLIRRNTTDSDPADVLGMRQLNGLRIRGGELTGGSVWDDTDISHVLFESVNVGNFISGGGLALKSRPDESLVVKLAGRGTPNSPTAGTGITATGSTADISDRIGGTVHVLGLPGAPVVLTSLKDDSVGAGRKSDGTAQNDTNGDGVGSRPAGNDWRSLFFDNLSNDRNSAVVLEQELSTTSPPGLNATVENAQVIGDLAERLTASDDQLRLGFEVQGFIGAAGDIDTYTFTAAAGTQVWVDMDRTSLGFDGVLEVVDDAGNVIARSDNSFDEVDNTGALDVLDSDVLVGALGDSDDPRTNRWLNGQYDDFGSTNLKDAGLRITLPGVVGTRSNYFVRVRAASQDPGDVAGGETTGAYTFQLRLQEKQEFPGSVVRYADIRYANHGIHVQGLPGSSPLIGEAQENESADPFSQEARDNDFGFGPFAGGYALPGEPNYPTDIYASNDEMTGGFFGALDPLNPTVLNARPQNLGDLIDSKTGTISVGGQLADISDVDFYQIDIDRDGSSSALRRSTVFDVDYAAGFDRPDTNISVFYSPTGNPNQARLVLFGQDSNILDDQDSPLSTQLLGELLERGSISSADPMIGPVALPAGSYFVAVTESGRVPTELTDNTRVRRSPIESVVRIFDDHVESIGGATGTPPVERDFVGTTSGGWTVTTDRDRDLGHDRPDFFESTSVTFAAAAGQTSVPLDVIERAKRSSQSFEGDVNDGDPVPDQVAGTDFMPDTVVLSFKPEVPQVTRNAILSQHNLQVKRQFQTINAMVVTTEAGADVLEKVDALWQLPEIRYAEPDYIGSYEAVPNDPLFPNQWHYDNTGQTGGTVDADIDLPEAWDIVTGSDQVVLASIDSGMDLTHPDIIDNLWVNPGEIAGDGIDNDNNGYIDDIHGIDGLDGDVIPQDTNGHGTHVGGTMAATGNNAIGVSGVNQNSKLMVLRTGDAFPVTSATLESIDYATMMRRDHGINVVASNNSYSLGFSFALRDAIAQHNAEGILFVAAAGNSALNNDLFPSYPASFNLPGIVSVASSDDNDDLSFFSNFGAGSVDLAAPGSSILSLAIGGGYSFLSGTSMASPHVAGVAGLLAAYQPGAALADIKDALLFGADPILGLTSTSITGARLNAAGALAALPVGTVNNESIRFDRSEAVGTLTSNSFDLTGYTAADLPRFYFDYFIQASQDDDIVVQAYSNEQPTPTSLDIDLNDRSLHQEWRQAVLDLGQYAGDSGVTIEFVYTVDPVGGTSEGMYLDNFIVGFAERGEMVADASFGAADFTTTSSGTAGHYQLEVRPGTDYITSTGPALLVERALSADPQLIDPVILSMPSGQSIVPYETFTIEVLNEMTGLDETLTFQFVPNDSRAQNPSLVDPNAIAVGYQRTDPATGGANSIANRVSLAIRGLADYAFFQIETVSNELTEAFDTNDRHTEQLTLIAPAGDQITEGDSFRLGDGSRSVTFEFSTDSTVTFGNIRVPYSPTDTQSEMARRLILVINSGVVQGTLQLRASTTSGEWDFNNPLDPDAVPSDGRIALHGNAVGNFAAVESLAMAPAPGTPLPRNADGSLVLSAIHHDGFGDSNTQRTQGQVIVENNKISEVRAIGIWSDPGYRDVDPEDARSAQTDPSGTNYVRMPPVGNTQLGGVINFPELNDSVEGGIAPGLVAQNNIIDQAGYTGIKVDGQTRPMVIEWNDLQLLYASGNNVVDSPGDLMIPDGFIFALDAGGTRVVFEFEELGGVPTNLGGSGQVGGDGWVDGHVPVFYRLGAGADTYNPNRDDPVRNIGSTVHEVMLSIYESIQGSILVTNGLVELVRPTLGPSLTSIGAPLQQAEDDTPLARPQIQNPNYLDFFSPAIYLEGVTGIYASQAFQKQVGSGRTTMLNLNRLFIDAPGMGSIETEFNSVTGLATNSPFPMMPIAEAPQPLAKLVNNTVRGSDGTEGAVLEDGSLSPAIEMPTDESNDTLFDAVDTKLEVSHRGAYFASGTIGDNVNFLPAEQDVDFFKVELAVGDRLIVDTDTGANGPSTQIRVFDSSGIEVFVGQAGQLPEYLNPGSTVDNPVQDDVNSRDSFVDFTALKKDTYFVGISSVGNEEYEAKSLAERTSGTGGTGDYDVAIEVLAPRSFVFSLDTHPLDPFGAENLSGNINGIVSADMIGTTFTISQIPDYLIPTRAGDAYAGVNADGNRVTFEFTAGVNRVVLANGNINVPILTGLLGGDGFRVNDIMRAIANAISGFLNNPALPNHEVGNGPNGNNGPISRVTAMALGGSDGDNVGIANMTRENGVYDNSGNLPFGIFGSVDYPIGYGHDRRESGGTANIVPNGTLTDSRATTELYVLVENAAKIELSPEARAAGLKLGPDNTGDVVSRLGNSSFSTESDQLLAEQGIHIGSGASASVLNNVVVNAHQSLVREESSVLGFGGMITALNPDISPKQGSVVAAGNAFQYDDHRNTQMRSDISWWVGFGGFVNTNFALDTSLSTDLRTGPSNIAGGNSDFNFVVRQPGTPGQSAGNFITIVGDDLLEDGPAGRFTPAANAAIIDSAVDSIDPLVELVVLNAQLDIPTQPITAPARDFSGQLRADEPNMAPPVGVGSNVFKDRGAVDRADFVGPTASLETPQDNDFAASDSDPAISFVNRQSGVFTEFRILVQDLGDDSDPFVGSGIDDTTVVVPPIPGLRSPGANITLFENERMLIEGIDYSFSYDETRGVVTLKAIAGVWRNDRAYRIQLNNRDRTVLVAPKAGAVSDGQQVSVTDSSGGNLIFEFETGYLVRMPEAITLQVPQAGTNQGGLIDGGIFTIDDGVNPVIVFEMDSNGTTVPGSVPISLPTTPTPIDNASRIPYLESIAQTIADSIQSVVDDSTRRLNVDVRADGTSVIISSERNTRVDVSTSGLLAAPRTIGLQVPLSGADVGGVAVGETFQISDGNVTEVFEFVDNNTTAAAGNIAVDISPVGGTPLTSAEVANLIINSVQSSGLNLTPSLINRTVYLNLPVDGSATVPSGRLRPVSIGRTPADGDLITFTPSGGSPVVFEINRTDEPVSGSDTTIDDGVTAGNIPLNITRDLTGDELAELLATAVRSESIAGLDVDGIRTVGGGVLRIGGEVGLDLTVASNSIAVSGAPGVTGASTLEVFGPLLLQITTPVDGDRFSISDPTGTVFEFEFDTDNLLSNPTAIPIRFNRFDDQNTITAAAAAAIDSSPVGITTTNRGGGVLGLGRIETTRVLLDPIVNSISTRRGIVSDGEVVTISQGNVSVTYEFESVSNGGGVASGNIPVSFQLGSTPLDVARSLAGAIQSNSGGLTLSPMVNANGLVELNDVPGTAVNVTGAPSIILTGVPGGATQIDIAPDDTQFDINRALLRAINASASGSQLVASDRGGATLFVENASLIEGPVESFFLPAIKDLAGNSLAANRDDNTTQFTLLLPTVGLDYGDAPDPRGFVDGRYPTLLDNDGARHVVSPGLTLGGRVDAEPNALVTPNADGDDLTITATTVGQLFDTTVGDGFARIDVVSGVNPLTRDGDTITLTLADRTVRLEFDVDGIFAESNFAIAPTDPSSVDSITAAIAQAIGQTGLNAGEIAIENGSVLVYSDDEDGVSFVSELNPNGNISKSIVTPITVTVTGTGILQGWIDFNADGDWNDPGEMIIDGISSDSLFSGDNGTEQRVYNITVPSFASPPPTPTQTFARFRLSREGGLEPKGLALSGEVEDYAVMLVPETPPDVSGDNIERTYTAREDGGLLVLDSDGNASQSPDDDGLLRGIVDAQGDNVAIFRDDVGTRTLFTESGENAGTLNLSSDGTFTFFPSPDFNGPAQFTARVTDVKPGAPATELVSQTPITVTIDVAPVNDQPFAITADVTTERTIDEDNVVVFTAEELIDPFYQAGPANEADQPLIFQSVFSAGQGESVSSLGGVLEILGDGRSIRYTPPADYNGSVPDTFSYVVADVPEGIQISQSAAQQGTVSITIDPVNDPPVARADTYGAVEDTNLVIPIRLSGGIPGILDNDTAGPQNEIDPPESQTVSLVDGQFDDLVTTARGGFVRADGSGALIYTPPLLYSGPDSFTYVVEDSVGGQAVGTVNINVGGENDSPRFEGVEGAKDNSGNPIAEIPLFESKPNARSTSYDLATWFSDPENDPLMYTVTSSDPDVVAVSLTGSSLTLTQPAFAFGQVQLTVTATDDSQLSTVATVTVDIENENDSPQVLADAFTAVDSPEDTTVVRQLSSVFSDPDNDALTYVVSRLGTINRPSAAQIAAHPLLQSIVLASGQMRITPKPDQYGTVDIEIEASDGSARVTHGFTLDVIAEPDAPQVGDDAYSVAIGSTLRVLDPANGLLRNDSDADNIKSPPNSPVDPITVDLNSLALPASASGTLVNNGGGNYTFRSASGVDQGTLMLANDGSFTFNSALGNIGNTLAFTYRAIDSTGRPSAPANVQLTLTQSQYQNPIEGRREDVNADGFITPVDALRVINLLAREGTMPVSELGSPPPDFYDVDGNGLVTPQDALLVINALASRSSGLGEGEGGVSSAGTTAFATPTAAFLPVSNAVVVSEQFENGPSESFDAVESTDALLQAGIEIGSAASESASDWLSGGDESAASESSVDDALTAWLEDMELPLE